MQVNKVYIFSLPKRKEYIDAESPESARRKLMRRRKSLGCSYAVAFQAPFEEVIDKNDAKVSESIFKRLNDLSTPFREVYLQRVDAFERNRVQTLIDKYSNFTYTDYFEKFSVVVEYYIRREKQQRTILSKEGENIRSQVQSFLRMQKNESLESHFIKTVSDADKNFTAKLAKLSVRLGEFSFSNNFEILSAHTGVNFEATLVEGDKKVRAYTIIAEGKIQRPHYRYLVKQIKH